MVTDGQVKPEDKDGNDKADEIAKAVHDLNPLARPPPMEPDLQTFRVVREKLLEPATEAGAALLDDASARTLAPHAMRRERTKVSCVLPKSFTQVVT